MLTWAPYKPSPSAPWNLHRVVHLHRRAGLGASWEMIQRDLADSPDAAVIRLLEGKSVIAGVPTEFESLSAVIGQAAVDSGSPERLKAWWLYRCLFTPHPLQERLTLLWHNHFATSNLKVDNLALMKRQNETLRKHALALFGETLRAMVRDPALLMWLDAPQNRKEHPNENLARELMELFTLGIGHYTENDIKEAARTLTGWTVRQSEFQEQSAAHDDSKKEILGRIGQWSASDLVNILLEQQSTARRIAGRLVGEFFGEGVVSPTALDELAVELQISGLDMFRGVKTILRSELFFSEANIGTRIADPVSFLISPLRAVEAWRSPPSTLALAEWITRMGQDLFYPPNVGGWPGGRSWLTTRSTVARANCMAALASGQLSSPAKPPDFASLAKRHGSASSKPEITQFLNTLLYGCSCNEDKTVLEILTSTESHLN